MLKFPKNLAPLENQHKSNNAGKLIFPAGFYWGTATSSYQVEGGIKNDWSEAGKKPRTSGAVRGKYDAGRACDHYNKFEEDFDLAKKMNNNAHRFSIEWARIEPEEGKFSQKEIEHYRKVILALKERNLEPFVTLYHWTLPVWFAKKGGWEKKKNIRYFLQYVEFVVKNFPDINFWIIFNEPYIYSSFCYLEGKHPPFKKNIFKAWKVLHNLIRVQRQTYRIIHKISPNNQLGITIFHIFFHGILKPVKYYRNFYFLKKVKNYQDFIGVSYYHSHSLLEILNLPPRERTQMGWAIHPKGIYYVLKDLKKYNKPIYITENGIATTDDKKRIKFIIDHLKWIHKAIEEEVDVRGYFHWAFMDNFEWAWSFKPRFGLIEIDYKTLKRIPRPSSKVYAEICKSFTLPEEGEG